MKNGKLLLNKVFEIFQIKLSVYNYITTNLWTNYIFIVYLTCFIFKAQTNYIIFY
jgi:hypothetical protein